MTATTPGPWLRVCAALALVLTLGVAIGQPAATYAVRQRWNLGAAGKWDYLAVDTLRQRLYITRGDHVQVLDLPSGQPMGVIPNTAGVHGVAFAQDLRLGFTSNGKSGSVTVFDLVTLKVRQEVPVSGGNPDAILYEPRSHKLYTFNGKTADVTVLDAQSLAVLATVQLSGRPEFAVSDQAGRIYVNIEDKGEINVLDAATNTVLARWPLPGCSEPTGLALDEAHGRLFSVCRNKTMVVTDAGSGRRVAEVAIGEHPDAVVYDAASATVFSSNGGGAGSLSVLRQLDADHYAPAVNLPTEKGAKTMAMDPGSRRIYLPAVVNKVFTVLVVAPPEAAAANAIAGQWQGSSTCTNRQLTPACNDEEIQYTVTPVAGTGPAEGRFHLKADKRVNGVWSTMYELDLQHDVASASWRAEFSGGAGRGLWVYAVDGAKLSGSLVLLPSNNQVRKVEATRL
jgi:DNA-binding beta-propeller fold protein YncE